MTIDTKALREQFEEWYVANTFDYERNPIGSRECAQQWGAWLEAHRQAADRLAALESDLHRLRAQQAPLNATVNKLRRENERLREALRRFLEYGDIFAHRTSETNPYVQAKEALASGGDK